MIPWLLILFSATFLPISLYPEEYIQPKWMISVWAVFIIFTVQSGFGKRKWDVQKLPLATVLVVCYICTFKPFENGTALSLHLCILLPMLHRAQSSTTKAIRWFALIVELWSIITILYTQCRTGYLYLLLYFTLQHIIRGKSTMYIFLVLTIIFLFAATNYSKHDSSRGRWFILQRTIEIIVKRPLKGYGKYGFQKEYMTAQSEYFRKHPDSVYSALADDIKHPLNEFLLLSVNGGVGCALLLSLLLSIPFFIKPQNGYLPLRDSLMAVAVFSFFSYPLLYPLSWLVIIGNWMNLLKSHPIRLKKIFPLLFLCFLLFAYRDIILRRWGKVSRLSKYGHPKSMMVYYKPLYSKLHNNPYFLYDYAIESFYATDFENSYQLAKECEEYVSSYNLSLLLGDICRQLHRYDESISYYQTANWMCPVRFAPLEGMVQTYDILGDSIRADSVRNIILNKEIKIASPYVINVINKAKKPSNNIIY